MIRYKWRGAFAPFPPCSLSYFIDAISCAIAAIRVAIANVAWIIRLASL